jgi:hypothetical protein
MRAFITVLLNFFLFCSAFQSEVVLALYMREYPYKIADVIRQLKSEKDDATTLELLDMAFLTGEVFGIKTIYSYSEDGKVPLSSYVKQIRTELRARSDWEEKLSPGAIKLLEEKKDLLKKNLGDKSLEWAWVLNKLGHKQEAKNVLNSLFEDQYKKLMSESVATFFAGEGPLTEIQRTFKALEKFSESKEYSDNLQKMRNLKKHISTLPESHIMT